MRGLQSFRWPVKLAMLVIALLAVIAIGSGWWLPWDPAAIDLQQRLLPPGAAHWLGTDHLGRDIFSRLLAATRVSLGAVMACLLLVLLIGLAVGGCAGLLGGRADRGLMRIAELFMTFPTSILSFFMVGVLGTGLTNVILAIALSHWAWYARKIRAAGRPVKVLNLFGYTGGATLACAAAGATVCHVDASKGIVAWGKDNAVASGLADRPIRWLVDDCAKFVAREKRRGNTYDGIIMDPPSYGRGPGGEIWKLEDCIYELISQCEEVLSDTPLFFAVNSYTTGLSPAVMEYMLKTTLVPRFGGKTSCDEIGLPVSATGGVVPCGATAIWEE